MPNLRVSLCTCIGALVAAFPNIGLASTYYVDSSASNDAGAGTSPDAPWKTLAQVTLATLKPGDRVLLRCGQFWREQLKIEESGTQDQPIVIGRYGDNCATPPTIDATNSVTGSWTRLPGTNPIYYIDNVGASVHQLFTGNSTDSAGGNAFPASGANVASYAQFPNPKGTNPYLAFTRESNDKRSFFTGAELSLPVNANLAGATAHIRSAPWLIQSRKVDSYVGQTLQLEAEISFYPSGGIAGFGYFFTGLLWMLDRPGEWFHDPSVADAAGNKVGRLYFWDPTGGPPVSGKVFAAVRDAGIDIGGSRFVTIDGLKVVGAVTGINAKNTDSVRLLNNSISFSGSQDCVSDGEWNKPGGAYDSSGTPAINIRDARNVTVERNAIRESVYSAINGYAAKNVIVRGNAIIGTEANRASPRRSLGAVVLYNWQHTAVDPGSMSNSVENNTIEKSGFVGLVYGHQMGVSGNVIRDSCLTESDCGAMVNYNGQTPNTPVNTAIYDNFIDGVSGNPDGTPSGSATLAGIYLDDYSNQVWVYNNIIQRSSAGIFLHNAHDNWINNNTIFGVPNALSSSHTASQRGIWFTENGKPAQDAKQNQQKLVQNNQVSENLFVMPQDKPFVEMASEIGDTLAFATFDGNRYAAPYADVTPLEADGTASTVYGVAGFGRVPYVTQVGDLIRNGTFDNGAAEWHEWAADGKIDVRPVDGCASGGRCLRMTGQTAAARILFSNGFSVQSGKTFRIAFDVRSPTGKGTLTAEVRNGAGTGLKPDDRYESLGFAAAIGANASWRHYEGFFTASSSAQDVAYVLFTFPGQGTAIEVDNVVLVQVSPPAAANTNDDLAMVTNPLALGKWLACPVGLKVLGACDRSIELESGQRAVWPVWFPAHSSKVFLNGNDPLFDQDADGVKDSADLCPGTHRRYGVSNEGCPL